MLEVLSMEIEQEIPENTLSRLMALVSPGRRERIDRLHNKRKAVSMLMGEVIARKAISKRAGLQNHTLEFSLNQYGKPLLLNTPNLHFNISHSGNLVVCALDNKPVGVDVEIHKSVNSEAAFSRCEHSFLKIARRFFRHDENEFIVADMGRSIERFYEIWTMKESYVKWEGRGMSTSFDSFSVLDIMRQDDMFFHSLDVRTDASCSVCSNTEKINSHVSYDISDVLLFFESSW